MKRDEDRRPPLTQRTVTFSVGDLAIAGGCAAFGIGFGVLLGRTVFAPKPPPPPLITFTSAGGLPPEPVAPAGALVGPKGDVIDAVFDAPAFGAVPPDDLPAYKGRVSIPEPKLPALSDAPMASNPRTVVDLLRGPVDWSKIADPRKHIEAALGAPWRELLDPSRSKLLFDPAGALLRGALRGYKAPAPGVLARATVEGAACGRWVDALPAEIVARSGGSPPWLGRRLREVYEACGFDDAEGFNRVGTCGSGFLWCPTGAPVAWLRRGASTPDEPDVLEPTQGLIPDCYLMAALSALAWTRPDVIRRAVTSASPTLHTVRFSSTLAHASARPTVAARSPELVEVSDHYACLLSPPGASDDQVQPVRWVFAGGRIRRTARPVPFPVERTWPALIEKAFAAWTLGTLDDRPDMLAGTLGPDKHSLAHLIDPTRMRATGVQHWPSQGLRADLAAWVVARSSGTGVARVPMVAIAPDPGAMPEVIPELVGMGLVPNHVYTVLGWLPRGGRRYVILRNPWAFQGATGPNALTLGDWEGLVLGFDGLFGIDAEVFARVFTVVFAAEDL